MSSARYLAKLGNETTTGHISSATATVWDGNVPLVRSGDLAWCDECEDNFEICGTYTGFWEDGHFVGDGDQVLCNCDDNYVIAFSGFFGERQPGITPAVATRQAKPAEPVQYAQTAKKTSPPSYLTGEQTESGFIPDYPKASVTYLFPPLDLAVLSAEEASEFLDNLYSEYGNKDTASDAKSYYDLYKGTKKAVDTAKGLGGLGVISYVKNINGVDWIIIKNYRQYAKTLMKGNKWLASNPKIVQAGIGLTSLKGVAQYVKVNAAVEIVFSVGLNAADYILRDEATLTEFGVNSAADIAKGFTTMAVAGGLAVIVSGGSVLWAGAAFAIASFLISRLLDGVDKQYGYSDKLTEEFEKLFE